jgi:pre-rRNA-processing protein IPI3
MTTILFPHAVNAFILDPAERAMYIGTSASIIHQFNLFQSTGGKCEAISGDPSHPLQAAESEQYDFIGHSTEVTAISLSFDATLLVSGGNSGEIFIWDVGSRQVLRKIKGQNGNFFYCEMINKRSYYEYSRICETR